MKSLGKQDIYLTIRRKDDPDGEFVTTTSDVPQSRVVYEKPDGTFWINFQNSKRQVRRRDAGGFSAEQKIAAIRSTPFSEILERIRVSGGGVCVLPDSPAETVSLLRESLAGKSLVSVRRSRD